jgi:hypothetical protein
LLLNVYGRGGMLAVRPRAPATCLGCAGRECKIHRHRRALDARSCPSLLDPSKLDTNADCLVCGQCFKACQPDNLALLLRPPFHARDKRPRLASWPVTLFVMLVSGFVTYEMFSEWKAAQAVFLKPVGAATAWLGVGQAAAGWLKGVYVLLIVPSILWLIVGGVARGLGGANSLREAWRRLALPMAVVIAAGHMAKGLAKIVSWGGYLPNAIREPLGVETALRLTAKTLAPPAPWLGLPIVSLLGFLLVAAGIWFGIRETRLTESSTAFRRILPVALLGGFYLLLVAGWGLQRLG